MIPGPGIPTAAPVVAPGKTPLIAKSEVDLINQAWRIELRRRSAVLRGVGKKLGKAFSRVHAFLPNAMKSRINIGEKYGGDDETRTRDLCRDRAAF
jgi:hypothetical protein